MYKLEQDKKRTNLLCRALCKFALLTDVLNILPQTSHNINHVALVWLAQSVIHACRLTIRQEASLQCLIKFSSITTQMNIFIKNELKKWVSSTKQRIHNQNSMWGKKTQSFEHVQIEEKIK